MKSVPTHTVTKGHMPIRKSIATISIGLGAIFWSTSAAADAQLPRLDARLAAIAHPLTVANAPLCRHLAPGLGAAIVSRDQYPGMAADQPHPAFPDGSQIAISAVSPGSPAEAAGLRAGDALWLVDGQPWPARSEADEYAYLAAYRTLANREANASFTISYSRGAYLETVTIRPVAACRAVIEILPSEEKFARADARIVQVSSALAEQLSREDLAVVLAHELAHVILEHRRRLEAAGVKKGLLAEFGKNARRNRRAEIEADRLSVHLLANAGFDPALAPLFWLSETGASRDGGWLRSRAYPSRHDRAAAMRAEITRWSLSATSKTDAAPLIAWRDQSIDIED